jgi:two-component system sensor histidine kinase/response regulator
MRLQQIANNLLSNAIKFSDEGTRINIESYYVPETEIFQFSVTDNGIKITDEEASTLFKPHATLQAARDANTAGPGLGLYMCKSLCQQMGGNLKLFNKIKSTVGSKAFVANISAKTASEHALEPLALDEIDLETFDVIKSKILIFED